MPWGGSSAPAAPDPVATAAAQTTSNEQTARTAARINRYDTYGPSGSTTWQDFGNDVWAQYTHMNPAEASLYERRNQGLDIYADAALNQLGSARDTLSRPLDASRYLEQSQNASGMAEGALSRAATMAGQPVNTDYNAVRQQAIDAARARADPRFSQQEDALRSRLLASGMAPGSEAYDNEYRNFSNERNDAYSQIDLNAGQYANQAIDQTAALRQIPLTEASQIGQMSGNLSNIAGQRMQQEIAPRNQALNEATAMLTGQQIATPQIQPTPQTPVANTDVIGATMGAANINAQNYAAQQQANSGMWSGLLGLGGTLGGAAILSDERLKTDIDRVGKTDDGTPIYTYRMRDEPRGPVRMGVMAQELRRKQPDAVRRMPGGFFAVDYAKVS